MSRSKIILLDERFEKTGEPTVQTVLLWTPLRGKPSWERLTKEACASPALEYIKNIQPTPGRTVVLVIGLGSYEFYGLNRNGDGFNEQPYKPGKSNGPGRDAWVMEPECIQHHFHTYEQGNVYRHHVNRDPARSVGRVLKAFWNPFMHRVEVLEDIDNAKAPDLVEQIADGEFPAKSMGCRISFDVCTECGNRAPTRKQYCDHLKWNLNWLDPKTGVRYGALNPSPRFFDSSWVVRPADRTGFMLKKVAEQSYELRSSSELGDLVDALNAKSAAAKKLAVIDKVVRGYPAAVVGSDVPEASLVQRYRDTALPDVVARTPELDDADVGALAQHRLPDVLAALARSGVILTTPEFLRLFLAKAAPGVRIPDDVLNRAAALQAEVFELLGQHPSLIDDMTPSLTEAQPEAVEKISAALRPLIEKRATTGDYLWRRIRPRVFIPHDAPPTTDMLTVEDPTTGLQYQTTRGAAWHAQNALEETHLKRLLGAGALMAGAGKVLTTVPGAGKALALPLAGAGLYLGQTGLQEPATYTTTTGERVPVITEFAEREKQGGLMPLVNALGIEHQLTKTGAQRFRHALQQTSAAHPAHLFLQKQAQLGLQYATLTLADVLAAQDKLASDGITEEHIDLEKAATLMGELLWPAP
jgi:hypothetical protein